MSRGSGSHLLAELSSSAVTCFSAPDLVSLPRRQLCHVSHDSGPCLPERRALALSHVPQLQTSPPCRDWLRRCHVALVLPPREESSDAATYPTISSGLCTIGIKKYLTAPDRQLGSHVSKAQSRIAEAPARRADMPLQFGLIVQHRPS
jgi:hypothetical protein